MVRPIGSSWALTVGFAWLTVMLLWLVGFTTRLDRFGAEKGVSCSTTISAPTGSAMAVGWPTSTHISGRTSHGLLIPFGAFKMQ